MGARIGTNVPVYVQATLDTAVDITGITKANPGVCTATNTYTDGDIVVLAVSDGMVELDGQIARVSSASGTEFTLEGLDTTNYTAFASGTITATKVLTWSLLSVAQSVSLPDGSPPEIDTTTLADPIKSIEYGLQDAIKGTVTGLYDPQVTAVGYVRSATIGKTALACKIAWKGGQYTYFNALWSGGFGFDLQKDQAATGTMNVTVKKYPMDYAS